MTRPYRLLAVVPALAILGAPWFANHLEPRILGMPYLLAWIVFWIVMTSIVMAIIGAQDTRAR